jgi:dolichyl-phosphate beta-glucosyltransferase
MDLSIIIPCHNEANRLPRALRALMEWIDTSPLTVEIIVAENGSTDDTLNVARCHVGRLRNYQIIHLAERGKGAAVRAGMLAASGDWRYMADVDFSTPVDWIDMFWQCREIADVIIGSRSHSHVQDRWARRVIGRAVNWLVQSLTVPGISDTQCGFKLYSVRAAETIFPRLTLPGVMFDVEALYLAKRLGYSVFELPVTWRADPDSRMTVRDGLSVISGLRAIRRNESAGLYGPCSTTHTREEVIQYGG